MSIVLIFSSPKIQTKLANLLSSKLNESYGLNLSLDAVRLSFLNRIELQEILLLDHKDDTLVYAQRAELSLTDFSLRDNSFEIGAISLRKASANLIKYAGDSLYNYEIIVNKFANPKEQSKAAVQVNIETVNLERASLSYQDFNQEDPGYHFKKLFLSLNDISLDDGIHVEISKLAFEEQRGLVMKELELEASYVNDSLTVNNFYLATRSSTASLQYSGFIGLDTNRPFLEQLSGWANFYKVDVSLEEFRPYVNELPVGDRLLLKGEIMGSLAELRSKDFEIMIGEGSSFKGAVEAYNLSDPEALHTYLSVENLILHPDDYTRWYAKILKEDWPEEFEDLGQIHFVGDFEGGFEDFDTDGALTCKLGYIEANLNMINASNTKNASYYGQLALQGFDLRSITKSEDLDQLSLSVELSGKGLSAESFQAKVKGVIDSVDFKQYRYTNILLEGDLSSTFFAGEVSIDEPNLKTSFNGVVDLQEKTPVFDLVARVDYADLYALNLYDNDSIAILGVDIDADFEGASLDDLDGRIELSNTTFETTDNYYYFSDLNVYSKDSANRRVLVANSDMATARVEGQFNFAGLYQSTQYMISRYFSKDEGAPYRTLQQFTFEAQVINIQPITDIFIPELYVESGTRLEGSFNSAQANLELDLIADEIRYEDYKVRRLKLMTNNVDGRLSAQLLVNQFEYSKDFQVDSLYLKTNLKKDTAQFNVAWKFDDYLDNRSQLNGYLSIAENQEVVVNLLSSQTTVNKQVWNFNSGARIAYADNRIKVQGLSLENGDQHISLQGVISEENADKIYLDLKGVQLKQFNQFLVYANTQMYGEANIDGYVQSVLKAPIAELTVEIDSMGLNGQYMGDLDLMTAWVNADKQLQVQGSMRKGNTVSLEMRGHYFPLSKGKEISLDLAVKNFNIKSLENYLASVANPLYGKAYGDLKVRGSLYEPEVTGDMRFQKANFRVPMLNTQYNIDGQAIVHLEKNYIEFQRFKLVDQLYATKADIRGRVYHERLKNIRLDLEIETDSLLALNTDATYSDLYYGKAFASGFVRVKGSPNNVSLDIIAKAHKGTSFSIPLTGYNEVGESDFISFVNTGEKEEEKSGYQANLDGVSMNFQLEVTPEAEVEIIFDETVGDIMRGKGEGNLQMLVNSIGEFTMYGDYTVTEGSYLFTLENVISKPFSVEPGGTISWNGDPYLARLDLTAVYKKKTSLYNLQLNSDTSKINRDVELQLHVGGNLSSPDITFDIEVPNAPDAVQAELDSKFRNQNDLNTQVISLLVLNQFIAETGPGNVVGRAGSANATELLSTQLSNWLNQISDRVDVGVNYTAGSEEEIRSREVEVALSTQVLNDRVTINGNVGVPLEESNNASQMVGDVNVEVNITEDGRVRAKAFNRSNEYDPISDQTNTTQGIGVFYREEFDTWSAYIKKIFSRKKKAQSEGENP